MSGKDETDLVRNKELTTEHSSTAQSLKSNHDQTHDHSNGDSATVNGDSSKESSEKSKQTIAESAPKPTAPSNWVKFENEDDNDTVCKHLISH